MTVYLITNLINGKKYVGQTIQSIKRRWDFHVCGASRCIALNSAIKKYGKENFKIESIYEAHSLEELTTKEASRDLKINSGQICHVLNGKCKQAKGYTFKRV